jgi:hypothetical protein
MTKVCLEGTRIRAIVCQLEAAGVPQHVRMHLDLKFCLFRSTLEHPSKPSGRKWCSPLGYKNEGTGDALTLESAQRA